MKLPLQFPNDADVIAEESTRFSNLSSHDRMQVICNVLEAGALMLRQSPRSDFLRQYALEQENAWRLSVQDFIARHGDRKQLSSH
jgi:hypothetical protein